MCKPDWAKYKATDKDGEVWYYEKKPKIIDGYLRWVERDGGRTEKEKNACPNWMDTLEELKD